MACRLAEKGYKVCLLERGRQYPMYGFPRRVSEFQRDLFWDPEDEQQGLFEFRSYPGSDVFTVNASGLGGGSLIYANVLMPMPPEHFNHWPGGIDLHTMESHYAKVLSMMEAGPYPQNEHYANSTAKARAFQKAALAMQADGPGPGLESMEFVWPHLAIRFANTDKNEIPGVQSRNRQGVLQGSCIGCGECDVGCNVHAKNTLDLNYLARATSIDLEKQGGCRLEIRTRAQVTAIESMDDTLSNGNNLPSYNVCYRDLNVKSNSDSMAVQNLHAKKVILSIGSPASPTFLLQMQKMGYLKNLSKKLGKGWCGNGDLEGTVLFADDKLEPTRGPVITGAIKYKGEPYADGHAHSMVIQDGGFPYFLEWFLAGRLPGARSFWGALGLALQLAWQRLRGIFTRGKALNPGELLATLFRGASFTERGLILLGMGRDRNDGEVILGKNDEGLIRWRMDSSRMHYERLRSEMKRVAARLGGFFQDNPLTYLDKIVAVHPIGGCNMANVSQEGVVGPDAQVFGHPGLYVVDASILPASTGPNPSLTIAANAERIAALWPDHEPSV